ncbi:MAG: class I SAM-dependent methyltransferase [Candidatus Woesearchaeota archaeon]
MTDFHTLWEKSSSVYDEYSKQFHQYIETSKVLVQFAGRLGPRIVDLACGTGITTKAIADVAPDSSITAIDFSLAMLEQAKKNINAKNILFIHDSAENVHKHVKGATAIICNSAFWQFPDQDKVLYSINKALSPDGIFVFNLPHQFFDFGTEKSSRGPAVSLIIEELRKRGYHPEGKLKPKMTQDELTGLFGEHGLDIIKKAVCSFQSHTIEDSLAFFKIPAVSPFFDDVPANEQDEILKEVGEKLRTKSYNPSPARFMMFKTRKTQ